MRFLIAFAAILFTPQALQARTLAEIKASGQIVAATNGTFPPFSYYDKLKLSGFEIDLVEALAKDLGVKVDWKVVPFDTTLIGLNQNRYDLVIASHGITPERSKMVEFTEPYYCSPAVIMSLVGGPKTKASLKGRTLGAQVGTTYLPFMQSIEGHGEIKSFKSESDTLLALMSGRVDAMIGDRFAALIAVKARPAAKLQVGDTVFQEKIAMAIQKGNLTLVRAIDESLAKLQKSKIYSEISQKHFGEDIRCK